MKSRGLGVFALILAIGWLYLGVSRLTDGRTLEGVLGLVLALSFIGWAIVTARKGLHMDNESRSSP